MKKIGFFGLLIFWIVCLGMTVNAAILSPALSVMQNDFAMVKTGVGLNTVSFNEEDFTSVLGNDTFTAIVIESLPDEKDGVLKLGKDAVQKGDVIERAALPALRFVPAEAEKTAVFHFLPVGADYEKPFVCTVYMLESLNFAPTAEACALAAKESIPVYASLTAADPDGDPITYHLVSAPKNGKLSLDENGDFRYTANENSAGTDSFSYYVSDPYGNRSETARVSITTSENKSGILYTDLKNSDSALPAALLAEKDAFTGEKLGDEWYFYPEKTVTRADFLMMAMRMCEIDTSLLAADESGFADSAVFGKAQNRYISAAAGLGLVFGIETDEGRCFCPNDPVTSEQASTILGRIAKMKGYDFGNAVVACIGENGSLSEDGFAMLASVGLVANEDRTEPITRADAAELLYTLITRP